MLTVLMYIVFGYCALAIAVEIIPVLWPLVELAAVVLLLIMFCRL